MCSTIGHTHKRFVGIKQGLKHNQQLVLTTTILHLSVKRKFFWHTRVEGPQKAFCIN